ncbi:MAG: MerC domain-containing protein [Balneolales bacterium]
MIKTNNRSVFSNLSIAFSSVCVLHCLMTPFLIFLLPALSEFFSETIELALVMSVVPLSLAGFLPSWSKHKNYALLRFFILGLAMIMFGQLFIHISHDASAVNSAFIPGLVYLRSLIILCGAGILAYAVYKNNMHTHVCSHEH